MPQTCNMIQKKGLVDAKVREEGPGGDTIDTKEEPGRDTTDIEGPGVNNNTK